MTTGSDKTAVCGPCAAERNMSLVAGFSTAACVLCGEATGRRAYNPHEVSEQCSYDTCYCRTVDGKAALEEGRARRG